MTVPLVASGRSVYAKRDSLPGGLEVKPFYVRVSQSVMILRNSESGATGVYLQSAVPDKECYKRNKNKVFADVNDKDFSGYTLCHRLDSRPVFLSFYRGGQPSGRYYFGDCRSVEDVQRLFADTRSATGRVSYVVNVVRTRDDYQYEVDLPEVVVKATCGCNGNLLYCGCESCNCVPEPTWSEDVDTSICQGCDNPMDKCTCGRESHPPGSNGPFDPLTPGGGSNGSGGSSNPGGSGGSSNPGGSSGPNGRGIFLNPDEKTNQMLDTIDTRCIGNGLARELGYATRNLPNEERYTNLIYDYGAEKSSHDPITNTIMLNSNRSDYMFHEQFHRFQCLNTGRNAAESLNAEIEARIAQYMYIRGVRESYHDNNNKNIPSSSGGTVIGFTGYTEDLGLMSAAYRYFERDTLGMAIKEMAELLYPNGYTKEKRNAEKKFRENMDIVAARLIKGGYEGHYDPKMSLDDMLNSLRRIAQSCNKK